MACAEVTQPESGSTKIRPRSSDPISKLLNQPAVSPSRMGPLFSQNQRTMGLSKDSGGHGRQKKMEAEADKPLGVGRGGINSALGTWQHPDKISQRGPPEP